MDRRSFLGIKHAANDHSAMPPREIQTDFSPYTGPWTKMHASHLLRRGMFGPKASEIEWSVSQGLQKTLDQLFTEEPLPSPPVNFFDEADPMVPIGNTWIEASNYDGTRNGRRRISLIAWNMGLMIHQGISLREKMALFWHNHFAIERGIVPDARFLYRYNTLLRSMALGNFQTLVEEITIDPTMLRYLNGNQNVRQTADGGMTYTASNENYGRELFELFTLGKGDDGTEVYYTEEDVRAAARVLTGWRDRGFTSNRLPVNIEYRTTRHDKTDKQFSEHFNNKVIRNNEEDEYKDLIQMIFDQPETARFICRKLYRWFVYYEIDEKVENEVIEPMAILLRNSNYDVAPAIRGLLGSQHFYDAANIGCIIKSPIDFSVGIVRQLEVEFPEYPNVQPQYWHWYKIYSEASNQLMEFLNPPNVAGWPAYYQIPRYHAYWISSVTLPNRQKTVRLFNRDRGFLSSGFRSLVQPLNLLDFISDPLDPNTLIREWSELLLPQPLEQGQLDFLKEVLIPGLPDYEWTLEYGLYLEDPADQELRGSINLKLREVLDTLMNLAEYQLS